MRRLLAVAAVIVAAGALLVLTGAVSLARNELRRAESARHAARGEVELRLVNPAGADLALYRAGEALDDAAPLPLPPGETWLPEGRHFVEATLGEKRLLRYGIRHASGNAPEWTQSVFRRYGADNPYRDDDRNGHDTEGMRVTRGGSWYSASSVRLRLAYREEFQPELSSDDLGFRIAAVLGAAPLD